MSAAAMFLRCDGETRSWMLLGTTRYQVGSDGGSSIVDASRNPTLPGRPVVAEHLPAQKMLHNAAFLEATIGRAWTSKL